MRFNTSTPTLFAAASLFCFGSSLPFFRAEVAWYEPLLRRATYSVVDVDGGSTATNAPATTIIETITQTPAPATTTIIETDKITVQPHTTTQTISGQETTKTLVVTISPTASTVTTTAYAVVNVSPSNTPTKPSSSGTIAAALSAQTTISSTSITSSTLASLSQILASTPLEAGSTTSTSSKSSVTSVSKPYTSSFTTSFVTSTVTSSATSTSTKSYDDGQWHTHYPQWSNGTATATMPSIPARTASPISLGADESLAAAASSLFTRALAFGSTMLHEMGILRK